MNVIVYLIHSLSTVDLEYGGHYALREEELRLENDLKFL